ncbi:UxaA family hydrolase [Halorubrum sp. CBA1125]|uniref:UxaA family hydrolase n=1 Tax=Halorubrum sp. CBA1125 TaxID=2668072 RepID=UPI0018D2592A
MKGRVFDDVALHMAEADNVVTAITDLEEGDTFAADDGEIELREDVPFGHKIALVSLSPGDRVVKYGEIIGAATDPIRPGEWVHTHNCESTRGRPDADATEEVNA